MTCTMSPEWGHLLRAIGKPLDIKVANSSACALSGIYLGSNYLAAWLSCLVANRPAPYLLFHGNCEATRTVFSRAAQLLTHAVARIDPLLKPATGYNAQLYNATLGLIENTDFSQESALARSKLRLLVESPFLTIYAPDAPARVTANTLHFIHTAPSPAAEPVGIQRTVCPVTTGDSFDMKQLRRETPIFKSLLLDFAPTSLPVLN